MKLKTRTNQPVEYEIETTADIEHLSDSFLDSLKCGDIITKKTGNQKHAYVVSYKEEKHGICLTYCDASGYIETISYDYTEGHWVYNSKDVFEGQEKLVSGTNIKTINGTSVLGSGNIAISGGSQLYKHVLSANVPFDGSAIVISTESTSLASFSLADLISNEKTISIRLSSPSGTFRAFALISSKVYSINTTGVFEVSHGGFSGDAISPL